MSQAAGKTPGFGSAANADAARAWGDDARPTLAVTIGDPGGIGAEVIVKALCDEQLRRQARFVIYGMEESIAYAADLAEVRPFWFRAASDESRRLESGVLLVDFDEFGGPPARFSGPSPRGGEASMRFLDEAIADMKRGQIDALVTGPVSKTSWKLAGFTYPGHTELLAHRFRCSQVTMMFVGGPLKVALASVHEALFELRHSFTIGRVFQPIDLLHAALRDWFGVAEPRIGVAGLNPHASENGQFGDEEARIIEPAIAMARQHGIRVEGPFPADTLFWRATRGEFDGVVAMYHDQGLIPVKLLAFDRSVNLTLGLPVVRTSVDHGTAFDIAGANRANPGSMQAALQLAINLARLRGPAVPMPDSEPSAASTLR